MADRTYLEDLSRRLADEGKLIEAGWVAMRITMIPLDAPAVHLQEMRLVYMAGAQHLFASIMMILEPGTEATDADMRRIDLIDRELKAFGKELELRVARTKGSA